jgi:hypothetical protein
MIFSSDALRLHLRYDDDPENEIKKLMLTKLGEQIEIVSIALMKN